MLKSTKLQQHQLDAPEITTILTCVTDGEKPFLRAAVDSVLAQTLKSKILVCISRENNWISEILAGVEDSCTVVRLDLSPPGITRNKAMTFVNTRLVAFLDGDDMWHPRKLEFQARFLELTGARLAGCRHLLISEKGRPFFFGFAKNIPMPSGWIGETELFRQYEFNNLPVASDVAFWRQIKDAGVAVRIQKKYLVKYRVRELSVSTDRASKKRKLKYARLSKNPVLRCLLLSASYIITRVS